MHPAAQIRSADPQRTIDAERLWSERPPVQKGVLAGMRAEALSEDHDPRAWRRTTVQALEDPQPEIAVLSARILHLAQGQRRRSLGVLHGDCGYVASRQIGGRGHRH